MINKPRKWWIAGLLSLICPGVGHIYIGEARKGLVILALPILLYPAMILCLNSNFIVYFLLSFIVGGIAYYAGVIVDAIRKARRLRDQYPLKKYNKRIVYIGVIGLVFTVNSFLPQYIKQNHVQAFKIPAASMEPTLLIGDHILVDRRQAARNPNRGDLIVFEYPKDPEKDFVKRVAAVGGDLVMIRDKELFINDKAIREPYAIHQDMNILPSSRNPRDNFGPVTVPAGAYFVLGDNRDRSLDSRFFGFIDKSKIRGTVQGIYWSWDYKNKAVRWDRIGSAPGRS